MKTRFEEVHQPCLDCGSSDALAINEDGSTKCFSCGTFRAYSEEQPILPFIASQPEFTRKFTLDEVSALNSYELQSRGLRKDVVEFFGVKSYVSQDKDGNVKEIYRFYPVTKHGKLVGYKCRTLPKDFSQNNIGKIGTDTDLFGQSLWSSNRKLLIITVGQEDAMAAYQMTGGYASVSLTNGTNASKNLYINLPFLEQFEKVVFAVDQEEDKDLKQAQEWAKHLSPGKCFIARFSEKDANDMLINGKTQEFLNALRTAQPIAPTKFLTGSELWDYLMATDTETYYPFPECFGLNQLIGGIQLCRIYTVVAGTGCGKSTFLNSMISNLWKTTEDPIAIIRTEDTPDRLAWELVSFNEGYDVTSLPKEDRYDAFFRTYGSERLHIEEQFSAETIEDVLNVIKYAALGKGCKFIILDHISGVIDKICARDSLIMTKQLMAELELLVNKLNICLIIAAQPRKRGDKEQQYENGAIPNIDSIEGAGAIAKYSAMVIAIQREGDVTTYHIKKDRPKGTKGVKSNSLTFDRKSYRLTNIDMTAQAMFSLTEGDEE